MNRNNLIDICKGISILMIIDVHLVDGPIFVVGKTFHVAAFFLVSGLLHGMHEKNRKETFLRFVQKKTKGLMYPYFILSLISIVASISVPLVRDGILKTLSFRGIGTLWFLPVLFFAELLCYGIYLIIKKREYRFIVGIVVFISIVIIESVLNYEDNIIGGVMCLASSVILAVSLLLIGDGIVDLFLKASEAKFIPIAFIGMVVSLVGCAFFVNYYTGDIHKGLVGDPVIYITCTFMGLMFVCSMSILFSKVKILGDVLAYFGRNSLIVMTTHKEWYLTMVANAICLHLSIPYWLNSFISMVFVVTIEIVLIKIAQETKLKYLFYHPIFPKKERTND